MFCFRTHGEKEYVSSLNWIQSSTMDECSGMDFVACNGWVWRKAQLRVDFLYIRKSGVFWAIFDEERLRKSCIGRVIPSYAIYVFNVRDCFITNAFTEVTPY